MSWLQDGSKCPVPATPNSFIGFSLQAIEIQMSQLSNFIIVNNLLNEGRLSIKHTHSYSTVIVVGA